MNSEIDVRHLRYFVRVAEELHFGRAAERLGMAQAPLSQQIRQLEDRVGTRLLERTTRSVRLTAAGAVFLQYAVGVLADLSSGVAKAREASNLAMGRIGVGAVFAAMPELLPAAIAEFRLRYPAIEVDIVGLTTAEQIARLEEGSLDLGYVHPPVAPGPIKFTTLRREGFVLLMPADHPLAGKEQVGLRDLEGVRLVSQRAALGAHYHNVILNHCRRAGFQPSFVQESGSAMTVAVLVAAGVGLAIIPERAQFLTLAGVVWRPLPELPPAVEIALASHREEPSPVIQHFIKAARKAAGRLPASSLAMGTPEI